MSYRLGVDVGGTFTDLLVHDSSSGRLWLSKTPSTPGDQSIGVLEGIRLIAEQSGIDADQFDAILHGTTVATNAVLEKRGARVGLIVTEGFGHILHLAEAWTPGPLFGWMIYEKPEPLVDYEEIREVPERVDSQGNVVRGLDTAAAREAIESLRDAGVEALTVTLINSYANPAHEDEIARLVEELAPDLPTSFSSRVMPEFREYERAVTTAMNAYVAPALKHYLGNLRGGLSDAGARAGLQVVRSDGGLMSVDAATEMPVQTVLSGPAGGVGGAAFVASRSGFERILTFDMGGTSTDVAVCLESTPTITRETKVGEFPVRAPSVEVESIGAGGGSIAYIAEATKALRVGPESAGADPGPACYPNGGTLPTVTDANAVLGHLPPRLLGGAMELDLGAAHAAIMTVAEPLDMDVHAAAEGIIRLVNENMLGALRVVTVQKGLSPTDFSLVSFGGAGGLHANALATLLGCYPIIVPHEPGVLSALGFVASDISNEFSQTFIRMTDDVSPDEIRSRLEHLAAEGDGWLATEGVAEDDRRIDYTIDMRYHRQGYEIPIDIQAEELSSLSVPALAERFSSLHQQLYGFGLDGGAEVVNLRARAMGHVPAPETERQDPGTSDPSPAQRGTQAVFTDGMRREIPSYERDELRAGMVIPGYAIVEQYDATTVILPGHTATVDPWLQLLIRPDGDER
jgi:N-methylhydantoinase A